MAATTTYLQIVNNAINESGADSATFAEDGSDFTTRTDKYMNLFKTWASRAWRDIQIECYDWEFMQEQGLCNLDPGIMFYTDGEPVSGFASALANTTFDIYDQNGTVAIPGVSAGNFTDLTGKYTLTSPFGYFDLTGFTATSPLNIALKPGAEYFQLVTASVPVLTGSVTGTLPTTPFNATISPSNAFSPANVGPVVVTSYSSGISTARLTLQFLVPVDGVTIEAANSFTITGDSATGTWVANCEAQEIYASSSSISKAFIHSWKSFDFNEETQVGDFQEDIEEINQKSFRSIDYLQPPPAGEIPLPFMPWETFRSSYDISSAYPGTPRLITEDDTGRYRFFPALYYPYSIKFDYSRRPQILSAFGDIPRGINDEFTDLIMWRAINAYGEYMEQPSLIARSERHYKDMLSRLEQKNREKFHFKPAKLW